MIDRTNSATPVNPSTTNASPVDASTRRQALARVAFTLGSLAASSAWAQTTLPMKEVPASAANQDRTSLHQEIDYKTTPLRIYEALLDSKQFATFYWHARRYRPESGRGIFHVRRIGRWPQCRTDSPSEAGAGVASHALGRGRLLHSQVRHENAAVRNPRRSRSHRLSARRVRRFRCWLVQPLLESAQEISGVGRGAGTTRAEEEKSPRELAHLLQAES